MQCLRLLVVGRNVGLCGATGDWTAFWDNDDEGLIATCYGSVWLDKESRGGKGCGSLGGPAGSKRTEIEHNTPLPQKKKIRTQ